MKKIIVLASLLVAFLMISACADSRLQSAQWQPHTTGHVTGEIARLGP